MRLASSLIALQPVGQLELDDRRRTLNRLANLAVTLPLSSDVLVGFGLIDVFDLTGGATDVDTAADSLIFVAPDVVDLGDCN